MAKVVTTPHDDVRVTDPDEYLEGNPVFARCREEQHAFPRSRDVPLIEAYDDPVATHQKLYVCPRCKVKKRERFQIEIRRRKIISFVQLDSRNDYRDADGYLAKGRRISSRYAREFSIRRDVETSLAVAASPPEAASRRRRGQSARAKADATPRRRKAAA